MNEQQKTEAQIQTEQLPELSSAELEEVAGGRGGVNRPNFPGNRPNRRR